MQSFIKFSDNSTNHWKELWKFWKYLFRYLPLKLNKEENETLQIKIEWKAKKIIFTYWIAFEWTKSSFATLEIF